MLLLCLSTATHYADVDTFIEVIGESEVSIVPQEIHLTLSLESQAWNAKEAKTTLGHDVERVLAFIKKQKSGLKPVKTSFVSVKPRYQKERAKQDFLGYFAQTQLRVVFLDEELYYKVIEKLPSLVEDYSSHVRFEIGDVHVHQAKLQVAAIHDGKRKATILAEATESRLGKVLQIKEAHMSRPGGMRLMEARSSVPIEAGEQVLSATVFLRYELLN